MITKAAMLFFFFFMKRNNDVFENKATMMSLKQKSGNDVFEK